MATYSLTVFVNQKWVQQFNSKGTKLCFASSVTSSKENFNVVASAKVVADSVTFTWAENYAIAATHEEFQHGVKIIASTKVQPIMFQQAYTLPANWTSVQPATNKDAPQFGFQFINEAVDATCVLYKEVSGKYSPIYASAAGPLPPGIENMIPKIKVRVWFANAAETSTMISTFESTPMTIDFTGSTSQAVAYDEYGVWSPRREFSDYSLERLQKELELIDKAQEVLGNRPKTVQGSLEYPPTKLIANGHEKVGKVW